MFFGHCFNWVLHHWFPERVLNFQWWGCEEFWKTEWRIGVDQIRCFGRIDVHKERAFPMLEMEPPATDDATRPEEDRRTSNLWSIRGSAHFNCLKGQSKKFQSSTLNSKGCEGSSVYVLREPSSLVTNYPGSLASPRLRKVPPAAFLIVGKQSFFLRILFSHQHPLKEGRKR